MALCNRRLHRMRNRSESWADLHSVLAGRKGDVEEHALLLCSLLLGFDLDAYCAIGTTQVSFTV